MALDTSTPRTRRALLVGALGAAAATAIEGIARPAPAEATTSYVVLSGNNTASNDTQIFCTAANINAFGASAAAAGTGVSGSSESGIGVQGFLGNKAASTTTGSGVYGYAYTTGGTTYGVQGVSDSDSGTGVYGHVGSTSGGTYGVQGESASTSGLGVFGHATATSGLNSGVQGTAESTSGNGVLGFAPASSGNTRGVYGLSFSTTGRGVYGLAIAATGANYGVYGSNFSKAGAGVYGTGIVGVRGESRSGRGGVFKGKAAQVRLSPSSAGSHPTAGQVGDMFVDASGRLWFCKGTTAWVKIA